MNLKIFIKKKDQFMEGEIKSSDLSKSTIALSRSESNNVGGKDIETTVYCLNDLISKLLKNAEVYGSLTFQIHLPDTNTDQSDVD
jgi:hypothetical protein